MVLHLRSHCAGDEGTSGNRFNDVGGLYYGGEGLFLQHLFSV